MCFGQCLFQSHDLTRVARFSLLNGAQLFAQRVLVRLEHCLRLSVRSFGCFESLLPLLGFLP